MNKVTTLILVCVSLLGAAGCVSPELAEANLTALKGLGGYVVAIDPAQQPLVDEAVTNGEAILDGAGFWPTVVNLGPPAAEIEKNGQYVEHMTTVYAGGRANLPPESVPGGDKFAAAARRAAEELEKRRRLGTLGGGVVSAVTTAFPWTETAIAAGVALAGALGLHLRKKGQKPPTSPAPNG